MLPPTVAPVLLLLAREPNWTGLILAAGVLCGRVHARNNPCTQATGNHRVRQAGSQSGRQRSSCACAGADCRCTLAWGHAHTHGPAEAPDVTLLLQACSINFSAQRVVRWSNTIQVGNQQASALLHGMQQRR